MYSHNSVLVRWPQLNNDSQKFVDMENGGHGQMDKGKGPNFPICHRFPSVLYSDEAGTQPQP